MLRIGVIILRKALINTIDEIIEKYENAFKDTRVVIPKHTGEDHISSGHLYLARLEGMSMEERNEIIIKMEERGISTNVHYKPLPLLTAYRNLGFDIKDYPNAYAYFASEITLPLHTGLTDEDVEYVIEEYVKIVKGICK